MTKAREILEMFQEDASYEDKKTRIKSFTNEFSKKLLKIMSLKKKLKI